MITLSAKINLLSSSGNVTDLQSNIAKSNISIPLNEIINKNSNGGNHFVIGANKVGDVASITSKIDYFSGKLLSNAEGKFTTPYEINIRCANATPKNLTITFDKVNNRYPSKIIVRPIVPNDYYEDISFNLSYDEQGRYSDSGVISLDGLFAPQDVLSVNSYVLPDVDYQEFSGDYSADYDPATNTVSWYVSTDYFSDHSTLQISIRYKGYGAEAIYTDNDSVYALENINWGSYQSVSLFIEDWNAPNAPFVLQDISAALDIVINKHNVLSLDKITSRQSDVKYASFGIISNGANIEAMDYDRQIGELAEEGYLQGGLEIKIYINNTLAKKTELIGDLVTSEWDYDNNSRVVKVSAQDKLIEWQDIAVEGFEYDPNAPFKVVDGTMANIYKWLHAKTPRKYNMIAYDDLDSNVKTILQTTKINYPFLKSSYLWQQWTKLCQVCGLCIYKATNGKIVCVKGG